MNKTLLTGGAIVAVCAVIGYTALGYATRSASEDTTIGSTQGAIPEGVQVADASGTAGAKGAEVAPTEPFPGTTTESGGFTGDVAEGGEDAKVTIIEYASMTCPHCATFHKTIYSAIKPEYIETDKVRFIFRDFPLDNFALAASVIARCGGESKFVGFVDLFMEKQDQWRGADNVIDELKRLARLGGLGSDKIDTCLKDQALGQSIVDRAREGQDVFEVRSTPTILINGEKFDGPLNLKGLTSEIDSLIGG